MGKPCPKDIVHNAFPSCGPTAGPVKPQEPSVCPSIGESPCGTRGWLWFSVDAGVGGNPVSVTINPHQPVQPIGLVLNNQQGGTGAQLDSANFNSRAIYTAGINDVQFPTINGNFSTYSLNSVRAGINPFPRSSPIIDTTRELTLTFSGGTDNARYEGYVAVIVPPYGIEAGMNVPAPLPGRPGYNGLGYALHSMAFPKDGLPFCRGIKSPWGHWGDKGGGDPCEGIVGIGQNRPGCKTMMRFQATIVGGGAGNTLVQLAPQDQDLYPIGFVLDDSVSDDVLFVDARVHSRTLYPTGAVPGNILTMPASLGGGEGAGVQANFFFNLNAVFAGGLPFPRVVELTTVTDPLQLTFRKQTVGNEVINGWAWFIVPPRGTARGSCCCVPGLNIPETPPVDDTPTPTIIPEEPPGEVPHDAPRPGLGAYPKPGEVPGPRQPVRPRGARPRRPTIDPNQPVP